MISHLQFFQQQKHFKRPFLCRLVGKFLLVRAMISGSYKYSSKFSRDLGIFFSFHSFYLYYSGILAEYVTVTPVNMFCSLYLCEIPVVTGTG